MALSSSPDSDKRVAVKLPQYSSPLLTRFKRAAASSILRVASVPSTHVYVRRVRPPMVQLIRDPTGDDLRNPSLLNPDWVAENAHLFDLMHIHFGFEHYAPSQLEALALALKRVRRPLIYTVHDLRNPNHAERDLHDAGLEILAQHATELITLTHGAAAEIKARFKREATVLSHPHVVPTKRLQLLHDQRDHRAQRRADKHYQRRIGLHLKSLRPNICALPVFEALKEAVSVTSELTLRVDIHRDVMTKNTPRFDDELSTALLTSVHDALLMGDARYLPKDAAHAQALSNTYLFKHSKPHAARRAPLSSSQHVVFTEDYYLFWSLNFAIRRTTFHYPRRN